MAKSEKVFRFFHESTFQIQKFLLQAEFHTRVFNRRRKLIAIKKKVFNLNFKSDWKIEWQELIYTMISAEHTIVQKTIN